MNGENKKYKAVKRIMSLILVLTLLSTIFVNQVSAAEFGDYGTEGIFCTNDTKEYQNNKNLSYLIYQINPDKKSVTAIGSYVIDTNGNIDESTCAKNYVIPEKVTYNGFTYEVTGTRETFFNKPVESVSFPNSLISLGYNTLTGTNVKEVGITKNVNFIDPNGITYNQYLKKLWVSSLNPNFNSSGNIVYSEDFKTLVLTANKGKKISVRSGVEIVKENAFTNCTYTNGNLSFVSILNELIFPDSIKLLEDSSVSNDVLLITFKGKKVPKILCNLVGDNGPLILVPSGTVSAYRKISYNNYSIIPEKVTSSLSTSTSNAYKKINDARITKINWSMAKERIYYKTSQAQWNKIAAYYKKVASKYSSEEDKITAVIVDILNTSHINEKYYSDIGISPIYLSDHPEVTTLPWTFSNLDEGTYRSMAVQLAVAAIRSIGSEAVMGYAIEDGWSSTEHDKVFVRLKNKDVIIIDITKEMGYRDGNVKIDTSNGLPTLKYYDLNRSLYNYSSKIASIVYYGKNESF